VSTALLLLLAPAALLLVALASRAEPGRRPRRLLVLAEGAALAALAVTVASAGLLAQGGPVSALLVGVGGIGIGVRLDAVSVTMAILVAFVGWVVLRYAATYLDGEARQGAFVGWMVGLHRLLLFYPDRVAAIRAARKKAVFARTGDVALVGAAALLWIGYGTADIGAILSAARDGTAPASAIAATVLLALAALLKSAQFPTHGWLTEVMEAPTPVSALLHAGVINAGGFLLIRFADVMLLSPGVLAVLVMVGGFTALFGGLVMLTQPAVKTSLAWSTVAQMGFMILQCGLALFPLALLHIVAHSLYKAHAFLASGTAVDAVTAIRRPGPVAVPGVGAVLRAFGLAVAIYAAIGVGFGFAEKSPQAIALGAILIFGVAYLIAQGLADTAPRALTLRTSVYSVATAIGYFALQRGAEWLTAGTLPATPAPGPLEWALVVLALASFGTVALAQSVFPLWAHHPATAGLRVHLANGLYANAVVDRMLGGWAVRRPS
jgi:NAD(P)H-quinone oxidoreductase subunit 5